MVSGILLAYRFSVGGGVADFVNVRIRKLSAQSRTKIYTRTKPHTLRGGGEIESGDLRAWMPPKRFNLYYVYSVYNDSIGVSIFDALCV